MNHHGTGALRDSIIQAVKKRASETDRELASCSVAPSLPCRKFFHVLPRFLRSTFATLHPALSTAVPRGPSSSSQDAVHLFSPSFFFFFFHTHFASYHPLILFHQSSFQTSFHFISPDGLKIDINEYRETTKSKTEKNNKRDLFAYLLSGFQWRCS